MGVVCYPTAAYSQPMSISGFIDYYFSCPQKRLMSLANSTRKVNTILKCQEINDIVLRALVLQRRVTNVLPFSLQSSLFVIVSSLTFILFVLLSVLFYSPSSAPPSIHLALLQWLWSIDLKANAGGTYSRGRMH